MTIKEVSEKYGISAETLRYYERVGVIPPVTRTSGGVRDFSPQDLAWIETAKCMRAAGMPVEALAEYLRLYRMGDETIPARLALLKEQQQALLLQQERLQKSIEKLSYKISRYELAVQTGKLEW